MPGFPPRPIEHFVHAANVFDDDDIGEAPLRAFNPNDQFRGVPRVRDRARIEPMRWEDIPDPFIEAKPAKMADILVTKEHATTLREYNKSLTKGLFGYELEVEGVNLPDATSGWRVTKDGSLRGESYEYVLYEPDELENVLSRFDTLVKSLTRKGTEVKFSYRTSTHVHMNVLDLTKEQIQSLFYIAHLVEDALVRYSGEPRVGNRFCLRAKDAEAMIGQFIYWLTTYGFPALSQDHLKYSAINFATMHHYGSIEFRSLRGTLDKDVVVPWLNVLKNIYNFATEMSAKDVAALVKKSPNTLLESVFKEYLPLFHYSNIEQDVKDAYFLLIEVPHVKVVT